MPKNQDLKNIASTSIDGLGSLMDQLENMILQSGGDLPPSAVARRERYAKRMAARYLGPVTLTPTCPECGEPVAYLVAPHDGPPDAPRCPLSDGKKPDDPNSLEAMVFRCYALDGIMHGRSPWSRWHIFDSLFVVAGTGYTWNQSTGALYDPYTSNVPYSEVAIQPLAPSKELDLLNCRPSMFYTLGEESPLWDAPDAIGRRIRSDWLRGLVDMLAMLDAVPDDWQAYPDRLYPPSDSTPVFGMNGPRRDAARARLQRYYGPLLKQEQPTND